ncbi:hypothetical protein MMC07_003912 [Pseudocyphellaria aurata]|nr:hypothetical protein [Pseudocyphellaria aurata]
MAHSENSPDGDESWNMLRQRAARLSGDANLMLPARPISNNDTNPLWPACSISNVEFFRAPEETGIGVAGACRNDVVDDEHFERGSQWDQARTQHMRNVD